MKTIISVLGTVLIIFGIIGFSYQYIPYKTNENVAQIGDVKISAETEKVLVITPAVSAILLGAGIILVLIGISRKKM